MRGQMHEMSASKQVNCKELSDYFTFNLNFRSWYDEVKQYIWNVEPKSSFKAGQFSQMVWKGSKELGVGVGRTKNGKVIVVTTYWPRGNVVGQFLNNVKRIN